MDQATLAYAAGLMDGEGSILLSRTHKNAKRSPCVSITSTSKELIDFLSHNFGGFVVNQKTYAEHHKQAWIWSVKRRLALQFLELVRPFMHEAEKVRRADLLLTYYLKVTPRNGKYSERTLRMREALEESFFHPSTPLPLSFRSL